MISKVILLSYTPNPEKICDSAARLSQIDKTGVEIYKSEYNKSVLPVVMKLGHRSVAEHAYFNFVFENVSVFVEHFMIEFRLGAYTVKSRRYVDFRKAGFIIPDFLNMPDFSHLKNKFIKNAEFLFNTYSELLELDIPAEDARFILPYCFKSNFFLSMNARELIHAVYSMIKGKGSKYPEIKTLGESMLSQLEKAAPGIFNEISNLITGKEDKWEKIKEIIPFDENSNSEEKVQLIFSQENAHEIIIESICKVLNSDYKSLSEKDKSKIIDIIIEDRRSRELETANFTFSFNNVSYPFLTHFIRHRIHSPIIPPFEYTGYENVVIPHTIKKNEQTLKLYNQAVKQNINFNRTLIEAKIPSNYFVYSRIAGNVLNVVSTMNSRELYHFLALRTCERAQWEIREYSEILLKQLKKENPVLFKKAGPGCVLYGKCPEGKMTCGKMKEKQEYYSKL